MVTLKELEKTSGVDSLRRIHKNENLSFAYPLYDFLISGKYDNEVDFDVYLESKGFNLQRPYVWTIQQQEEFIWSMLYGRYIPPVTFIRHEIDNGTRLGKSIYKVIDGKQRLMTIKRFMMNEFPIHFRGKEIFWNDLDTSAKFQLSMRNRFSYTEYHSYYDDPVTDDEMIVIFNFYNFTGTPQEETHRNKLINALNK